MNGPSIDPRMEKFIRRHHVLTLATFSEGQPWCSNMFYAWIAPGGEFPRGAFVFTSDGATRHGAEAVENPRVAGSVVLESRIVGRLQGLQFEGRISKAEGERVRMAYLKKFPFAAAMMQQLWTVEPDLMKLTDNTLGFGKKLIWKADDDPGKKMDGNDE